MTQNFQQRIFPEYILLKCKVYHKYKYNRIYKYNVYINESYTLKLISFYIYIINLFLLRTLNYSKILYFSNFTMKMLTIAHFSGQSLFD